MADKKNLKETVEEVKEEVKEEVSEAIEEVEEAEDKAFKLAGEAKEEAEDEMEDLADDVVKIDSKKKKKKKKKKKSDEYVTDEELKLNFYTATVLLSVVISSIVTVITCIFVSKPVDYMLKDWFNETDTVINDIIYRMGIFEESDEIVQNYSAFAVGLLSVIVTIFMVVITLNMSKNTRKPWISVSAIAFVFSLAALIVCIAARQEASRLLAASDFAADKRFGYYDITLVAVIVNLISQLVTVIAVGVGKHKWSKEGKTY